MQRHATNDPSRPQAILTQEEASVVTSHRSQDSDMSLDNEHKAPPKRKLPHPSPAPKRRSFGGKPTVKFGNADLTRQEVWYGTDPDNLINDRFIVDPPFDDRWHAGRVIVDGLSHLTKAELFKAIKDAVPETAKTMKIGDVIKMSKGGFLIKIDPKLASTLTGWMGMLTDEEHRNRVRVHPPRSIERADNQSAILYGVPTNIRSLDLESNLLPPVRDVRRFSKDGAPSTTVKVTFHSEKMKDWVIANGYMCYDGYQRFKAVRLRRRKATMYCKTCKRARFECKGGSRCSELRCGKCGEAHRTSRCDSGKQSCQECQSEHHSTFQCPILHQKQADHMRNAVRKSNKKKKQKNSNPKSFKEALTQSPCHSHEEKKNYDEPPAILDGDILLRSCIQACIEVAMPSLTDHQRSQAIRRAVQLYKNPSMLCPIDPGTEEKTNNSPVINSHAQHNEDATQTDNDAMEWTPEQDSDCDWTENNPPSSNNNSLQDYVDEQPNCLTTNDSSDTATDANTNKAKRKKQSPPKKSFITSFFSRSSSPDTSTRKTSALNEAECH